MTVTLAEKLALSIDQATPGEPAWWSHAIELAAEKETTAEYQVWLAVRLLLRRDVW